MTRASIGLQSNCILLKTYLLTHVYGVMCLFFRFSSNLAKSKFKSRTVAVVNDHYINIDFGILKLLENS